MRKIITILILTLATSSFGQKQGHYYRFSSASKNIDSVKSISIYCMDANRMRTDGCDSLPEDIDKFYNLRVLNISESRIKTLPNSIKNLKILKEISLDRLINFNYNSELCKLKELDSLEFLGLWMAGIKNLPNCISEIKSLKSIDISHNSDLNIDSTLSILKKLPILETLNLGGLGNLKIIPLEISELNNLKSLKLDYVSDSFDYSSSFERLGSLKIKFLSLTNNRLNLLPLTITKLKNLESIDLSYNFYQTVPVELINLSNLKCIIIQNNGLKTVGSGICNLLNLEKIYLSNNWDLDIKEAINSLSKYPSIKEIGISACKIDSIPIEIRNFQVLEKLSIGRNPKIDFGNLFINLSFLKHLKYLNINDNDLTTLPKEIGLLTSLEYLNIGQNAISTLPEEFFNLQNLKVLNIYGSPGNRISKNELSKIKSKMPNCKIIEDLVFKYN